MGPLQKQRGQKVTDKVAFRAAVSYVLQGEEKIIPVGTQSPYFPFLSWVCGGTFQARQLLGRLIRRFILVPFLSGIYLNTDENREGLDTKTTLPAACFC